MKFRDAFYLRLSYYLNSRLLNYLLTGAFALVYSIHIALLMLYPTAPYDFKIDYLAAVALRRGYGPYLNILQPQIMAHLADELQLSSFIGDYYYPPLTAQLIMPLTLLPPQLASYVWLGVTTLAFVVAAWLLGQAEGHFGAISLALLMMMYFGPVYITVVAGQINGLMVLGLCWAFQRAKQKDQPGLGIGIAFAAMLKIVPLAHVAWLGWRQYWRAFIAALFTLVILWLVALPWIGAQGVMDYIAIFFQKGRTPFLIGDPANGALSGWVARVMPNSPWAHSAWLGLIGLVIGLTAIACWPTHERQRYFEMEFGAVTVAANLVAPYAFYHQWALMILPLFVLAKRGFGKANQPGWLLFALLVYGLMNGAYFDQLVGQGNMQIGAGLICWGVMVVWLIHKKWTETSSSTYHNHSRTEIIEKSAG